MQYSETLYYNVSLNYFEWCLFKNLKNKKVRKSVSSQKDKKNCGLIAQQPRFRVLHIPSLLFNITEISIKAAEWKADSTFKNYFLMQSLNPSRILYLASARKIPMIYIGNLIMNLHKSYQI